MGIGPENALLLGAGILEEQTAAREVEECACRHDGGEGGVRVESHQLHRPNRAESHTSIAHLLYSQSKSPPSQIDPT